MKNDKTQASYIFNKYYKLLILLLIGHSSVAQDVSVEISWQDPKELTINGVPTIVPIISGGGFEDRLPMHSFQQKFKPGNYQVSVIDVQTGPVSAYETNYLNSIMDQVPVSARINAKVSKARNEHFLMSNCIPYIKTPSGYQKIVSYKLRPVASGAVGSNSNYLKSYASNSVLNAGSWYKISVPTDGIFQLNRAFFKSMGVDVDNLDPKTINLYGNADGRLSELNSAPFRDDLTKNAIQFVGNSDTTFSEDEYFLFFGAGPNRWDHGSGTNYDRNMHIYSAVNHYFIHIDETDLPLRIQSLPESSLPSTQTVNSYTFYDIHENESVNLVQGGQRWYGEAFDATLTQSFKFNIPNLDPGIPIQVNYAVASNANGAGNNFQVNYNGSSVHNLPMSSTSDDYIRTTGAFSFNATSSPVELIYTFNRMNASIRAYLDFIQVVGRRSLYFYGNSMLFRDLNSVGAGNVSLFNVSGMSAAHHVWDITSRTNPRLIAGSLTGNVFSFKQNTDTLREFIAFNEVAFGQPTFVKQIENQDLHALGQFDYIIVSPKQFLNQAVRLGNLHDANGLSTVVVDVDQVYNEFSSGNQDATAIRRFVKMFYERAGGNPALQPKFLCLFGDATYDPKNRVAGNNYMIPTYEYLNSENHISALVTDDYFGFMDNNESIDGNDLMDIGVGRLLISNATHAQTQVDKIEHYMKNGINSPIVSNDPNSCCVGEAANMFGDWRQVYTNITDDEQSGSFITADAEPAFNQVQAAANEMNCEKIYSDAYTQVSTTGGHRYPDVVSAITDRVERGSLITNYVGHGGEVGAAEERIITIPQVNAWTNLNRLGLFVTATCEFTKFDDPSRESIGELISLNPKGGSIALMTTTRSVYISINTVVVASLFSHVIERDANFDALAFGEIMRRTKNTSGNQDNRRCFNLIGDPALKICLPKWRVVTDSINHVAISNGADTVRALTKMHVVGHLEDYNGNKLTTFNGVLSPTIFDKPKKVQTLANDPITPSHPDGSPVITFKTQKNALYKGRATITNGDFKFEFVVPKDIDFNYGRGKISYYADNKVIDADGWDSTFVVGGINPNPPVDNVGPELKIYLNDDSFVNGSISSSNPLLVVEAYDEYGINTVGNGIGHDITAVLDGNTGSPIVLNEYYKSNLDSYQNGKLQYTLRNLAVGQHTLDVKMWDVNNNSSTVRLDFTVTEDQDVQLDHVLNYPNPFTTHTMFMYEHNQSCASLETQINIYTVSGRLVKTINQLVPTNGFRVEGISWDGKDDFGDQLAKGVYVYQLKVTMPDGKKAQKMEKLVLLR
ncbi:type IX secretion system sortase PorU [Fluviicola chungangensis]|uniref:Type IX secretion system sortase PorU n=1 Tax=Fluviicola chungangensis TaxID=2597671 RepID=A0A556MJR3_9FLAO|nr:type IX secretion system sortase PorU [Fluviicola chungangensis]TSJ40140.1 type IX secretion system sortase PorU [Fluviicola chungangensis]